ncbi:MAG: neutral zinc metallopeptidase [Acidimicrobiales bacterium]
MRVPTLRRLAAFVVIGGIVAGCGFLTEDSREQVNVRVNDDDDDNGPPTTAGRDISDVEDRLEVGDPDEEDNRVILAALQDVEAYWENEFPDVYGGDFEPVSAFFAYGPDTESPPCGPTDPPYEEIAGNAFYCSGTDIIAWDTTELIPDLQAEFGDFTLGIVVAHEYGHAIQDRFGFDERLTLTFEQQADCFAGAWAEWVYDENAENFTLRASLTDLDSALAGFLQLRDAINTSLLDPNAHGTAFDRVSAFQDGFISGAESCAEYRDGNVPAVPLEFLDQGFLGRQPDAPFEEVEPFALQDLNNFWTTAFDSLGAEWGEPDAVPLDPEDSDLPDCGRDELDEDDVSGQALYCAADDYVAWDEAELMPELYEEIGDMAVALTIGTEFSEAALEKLGDESEEPDRGLRADCLTGAWIASSVLQDRGDFDDTNPLGNVFVLSPGDLDEAVVAFLTDPGGEEAGTAFVRIASLREGFFTSLEAESSTEGVEFCVNEFRSEDADAEGGE